MCYTITIYMNTGIHMFAALNGAENYSEIKEGFAPVLDEINNLLHDRYTINTITHTLIQFFNVHAIIIIIKLSIIELLR